MRGCMCFVRLQWRRTICGVPRLPRVEKMGGRNSAQVWEGSLHNRRSEDARHDLGVGAESCLRCNASVGQTVLIIPGTHMLEGHTREL